MDKSFGVVNGLLETIYTYKNNQNLVDNMCEKYLNNRASTLNMVITET